MALYVYNTLTRCKELFEPLQGKRVRIYTCGLTVQDYCHIGHARMEVIWDCFKNWLRVCGYEIYHVGNFTDLNEKIAAKAVEAGVSPLQWADTYIKAYKEDMAALQIAGPDRYVRVSEEISAIIALIERLIESGHAYPSGGNVYFKVGSYPAYGRLSGRRSEEQQSGGRIAISEDKDNPEDFALWTVPQPGEPQWDSPWGAGTPGWHIECSAMSMKYLGEQYEMHGGGMDLLFPHHENEMAQSCADGNAYAKYWLHHGMVNGPDGTKMSKSLNNFFRVRDILAKYPAWVLRFCLLSTHYRSPITFSPQAMNENERSFARLQRLVQALGAAANGASDVEAAATAIAGATTDAEILAALDNTAKQFAEAMDDDFNTAAAIAALFELSRRLNTALQQEGISRQIAEKALRLLLRLGAILGLDEGLQAIPQEEQAPSLDAEITALIAARQEARSAKDWARADAIRKQLDEQGIVLTDTPEGVVWKYK